MRVWIWAFGAALFAQVQQPSARYYPTDQERHQIYAKLPELSGVAGKLAGDPLYVDVAIYLKAGEFIISHPEEFFKPSYVKETRRAGSRSGASEGTGRRIAVVDEEERTRGASISLDRRRQLAALRSDHSGFVLRPADSSGRVAPWNESHAE